MRESKRAGGEFNHRLPNGDGPCQVCVSVLCLGVRRKDRKRECSILSFPLGDTPAVCVCLRLEVGRSGMRWSGEEVKEGDRDCASVRARVCVDTSSTPSHL